MRVLQIAPKVCWPLDTGARLRNFHLARVLSQHADVTLLAFTDNAEPATDRLNFYQDVIPVKRDAGYTPGKLIRGAIGPTPLPVMNYTTEAMKQTLARRLEKSDFDFVQLESIHMSACLPIVRAARHRPAVICDWHNIESELMNRYAEREASLFRRSYARRTASLMSKFENRALREFDAHLTVSLDDAERLRELNPEATIRVIENGVDAAYYADEEIERAHASARTEAPTRNRIVFVGSMDYHANIDAVASFAHEVWPSLHQQRPELIFTIVGRDPADEVRALASITGVEITGTVDDVRPFYREAAAAIVPLRVGGGSRLKILEAMAAGVPIVSTTLGAEGLKVEHGENILIADTNQDFSAAVIGVVDDEEQRKRLSQAGRALVALRYDWSTVGGELASMYEEMRNASND
jgi:polysaccharide biosynthesis protein PslH